jgi:hypothetical protein
MTAFAIDFQRDRATIAGDTLAYAPSRTDARPLGFISKVLPLPQIRGVLFSRGQYQVTVHAHAALSMMPQVTTIEAAAALPEVLNEASIAYAAQCDIHDYAEVGLAEVALCGWSDAERRMRLWQFLCTGRYRSQDGGGRNYGLCSRPRMLDAYLPTKPGLSVDQRLVATMQGAVRFFADNKAMMCGAVIGGQVLATEVTRSGMSTRVIHEFSRL